jgi:hypothetical protein
MPTLLTISLLNSFCYVIICIYCQFLYVRNANFAMTPSLLSFYRAAPQQRVALDDFQELGRKRVRLLSQVGARWNAQSSAPPLKKVAEYQELSADANADLLSHYAVRLAFCRYMSPAIHGASEIWWWRNVSSLIRARAQSLERVGLAGHCRVQALCCSTWESAAVCSSSITSK